MALLTLNCCSSRFYFLLLFYLFCHTNILKIKFSQEFRMFSQKSPFFKISIVYYVQISKAQKNHTSQEIKKRNWRIFSPLLKGQIRVPAPLILQASLRAVSELKTSIFLSSMLHFSIFLLHCRRLQKETGGNSFYHTEKLFCNAILYSNTFLFPEQSLLQ